MGGLDLGTVYTILGTSTGVWVVFGIMRYFQHDFVNSSRVELEKARKERDVEEQIADSERALRIRWQLHAATLERILTTNDIPFPIHDLPENI